MNVDWTFLARDLAAHLAAAADAEMAGRTLRDAQRDAAGLGAPADFWPRVASEYERQARSRGLEVKADITATLRRLGSGL
jgi:hypothetical protein